MKIKKEWFEESTTFLSYSPKTYDGKWGCMVKALTIQLCDKFGDLMVNGM